MEKVKKKKKAVLEGRIVILITLKNWAHQGFLYLDKTEKVYRIIWELIPAIVIFLILHFLTHISSFYSIIISIFIAHTLNWILNDNFWTCMMFTFPNIINPGNDATIKYLIKLQTRMHNAKCVSGCLIFGSLSRGEWKIKSDIDMRILRAPGFMNGFKCYLYVWRERILALINRQPLDLYMADGISFLANMRKDENPIFIKNNSSKLSDYYNTKEEVNLNRVKNLNELSSNNKLK